MQERVVIIQNLVVTLHCQSPDVKRTPSRALEMVVKYARAHVAIAMSTVNAFVAAMVHTRLSRRTGPNNVLSKIGVVIIVVS